MKFPDIHNLESIERRYIGKVDKQGLDLLRKMLKMDPKDRITPEEALSHPYFQKSGNHSEITLRKGRDYAQEENRYEELSSDSRPINSKNMLNHKVPVNNFMEERVKDDTVGNNKVTGLLKLKNKHIDNINSIRQNNMIGTGLTEESGPKGKSLGNKKVTNLMKEKLGPITEKKGKEGKPRVDRRKKKPMAEDVD